MTIYVAPVQNIQVMVLDDSLKETVLCIHNGRGANVSRDKIDSVSVISGQNYIGITETVWNESETVLDDVKED